MGIHNNVVCASIEIQIICNLFWAPEVSCHWILVAARYCLMIKISGYTVEYWIFKTAQKNISIEVCVHETVEPRGRGSLEAYGVGEMWNCSKFVGEGQLVVGKDTLQLKSEEAHHPGLAEIPAPVGSQVVVATPTNGHCGLVGICLGAGRVLQLLSGGIIPQSHPGTQRVQEFLLNQGDMDQWGGTLLFTWVSFRRGILPLLVDSYFIPLSHQLVCLNRRNSF